MAIFVGLLLLVAVAVAGLAINRWLAPLNDHSKKYDELDTEGVEIVVQNQKPSHERRLKLALPDLSSIQARSPVGPMKSSIRSALKELRSRQMVQSLCSRFESRLKVTSETEAVKGGTTNATTDMTQILKPTRTRRRDARDAIVAPVLSASDLAKEAEITVNARSNNLNKFLRSYASNLDNAISTERRVDMSTTDAISVERGVVMSTDAEDDVDMDQPHKEEEEEITTSPCETFADCDESGMELELDLHTLRLEAEFSNQCDSPPTAGSEEDVSGLVEATECDPLVDEGDNNVDSERSTASKLSLAFTLSPDAISKFSVPELTHSEPETVSAPPAKLALSRFREQVPSNGRRARGALKI